MSTTALPASAARDRRINWSWVGVLPFIAFTLFFLILPAANLIVGAFQDANGAFTLKNIVNLGQPAIVRSYVLSLQVSAASAAAGVLLGFLLALAVIHGMLPRWVRPTLMTFSGVASQFAGVPLAFAFLATLGRTGLVTAILMTLFDFNIYRAGFNLLSFLGLTLTYLYFQIPLMVLVITPALDGLKREWREAASTLGATGGQYWRMVALPILWPPMLGAFLLLFANAFGAIATAYALTGSSFNLITILLYAQIRGDALHDPNLGYALALGMIVITGVSNGAYIWLASRSARWIR
ncbi:MAG: ABC transporter permease subunit [Bosea sp.]|nr:ABC transporter permease subunit [Bosea sp. (in: a-proteobacteria)]